VTSRAATLDAGAAARCAFRTVLEHDALNGPEVSREQDDTARRRLDAAGGHRLDVATRLLELLGARAADARLDEAATVGLLGDSDVDVVVRPRLPRDERARRHGSPSLLVADTDHGARAWRPVDVHNHFVTTEGTKRLLASSLDAPTPAAALVREGRRLRKGGAWQRDLSRLAHHHRMLEGLDLPQAGPAIAGIVDRSAALWWFRLDEALDGRGSALEQYDARFAERVGFLAATEARNADPRLPRPGAPWWHRECESCPFATTCHDELARVDDVSLVRFTDATEQELLRDHGVTTRRGLASLDLAEVGRGRATTDEPCDDSTPSAVAVGRRLKDAGRLVLRARVEVAGTMLRLVDAHELDARRAEIEIDIDMESYDNATYLWGTLVTAKVATPGVHEGYRAFVEWGALSEASEGRLFVEFFDWLASTVLAAQGAGRSVGIYCFWEHAERGQMRRAMESGVPGLPSAAALDAVLGAQLVDMHQVVTSQIQTAGPAGLKVVAGAAGFRWRDEDPSGEASMAWYEDAIQRDGPLAAPARERLFAYNEDDCRATRALRDWLEGPARALPDVEGARPVEP
jgi:predicted RecB family nuclease